MFCNLCSFFFLSLSTPSFSISLLSLPYSFFLYITFFLSLPTPPFFVSLSFSPSPYYFFPSLSPYAFLYYFSLYLNTPFSKSLSFSLCLLRPFLYLFLSLSLLMDFLSFAFFITLSVCLSVLKSFIFLLSLHLPSFLLFLFLS